MYLFRMKTYLLTFIFSIFAFSSINCFWWDDDASEGSVFHTDIPVSISKYPYVVSIVSKHYDILYGIGTVVRFGAYITVLTTGSCVKRIEALSPLGPSGLRDNIIVRGNSEHYDFHTCPCGVGAEYYTIKKWLKHPQYKEFHEPHTNILRSNNDLGLLAIRRKLHPEAQFIDKTIKSIPKLTLSNVQYRGYEIFALGWGRSGNAKRLSLTRFNDLQILPQSLCRQMHGGKLPKNTFCLSDSYGYQSTTIPPCEFRGAPVVVKSSENPTHYLIGIVQQPEDCENYKSPPIITNISSYMDFIKKRI